ncbi:hypothetical protein ACERK3_09410 [Phycisphaerales bacterium AB-hyl4]|uniref:Tail terminator n=1 Tax=Natronomicrosphaera hydrolytica TaxID=3242702 RepID=A0ABV4U6N2_9BACT
MKIVTDVAEAVLAELNAGSFSEPFQAQRLYLPIHELAQLTELKVMVVARGVDIARSSREDDELNVQVDIGLRQRVLPDNTQRIDELLALVEAIEGYLNRRELAALPHAEWMGAISEPLYDPVDLRERHTFTAALSLTYRLVRQPHGS